MIDPHFFAGYAAATFVTFVISSIYFGLQWSRCWEENKSLRHHPSTPTEEPDITTLGDWGSALEGWVDDS